MPLIDDLQALDSTELIEVKLNKGPFEKSPQVFYYTRFTLDDLKKIKAMSKGDQYEHMVCTLIYKVLDADGKKQFSIADKPKMMRMDSDIIVSMVEALNQEPEESQDAEKN